MKAFHSLLQRTMPKASHEQEELRILMAGKRGQGKSALVNGLIGHKIAKEGQGDRSCTEEVTEYSMDLEGTRVTVFNSPVLQDRMGKDKDYATVRSMQERCQQLSLVVYCTKMTNHRLTDDDRNAMSKLTQAFGEDFLKYSVIALTFANDEDCARRDERDEDLSPEPNVDDDDCWKALEKQRFKGRLKIREEELKDFLVNEIKVNPKIVKSIPVVPTGDYLKTRRNPTPYRLPDRDDWFKVFRQECCLRSRNKQFFLKNRIMAEDNEFDDYHDKQYLKHHLPEETAKPYRERKKLSGVTRELDEVWRKLVGDGNEELREQLDEERRKLGGVTKELDEVREELGEERRKLGGVTRELGEVRKELDVERKEMGRVTRILSGVRKELKEERRKLVGDGVSKELREELDGVKEELAEERRKLGGVTRELGEVRKELDVERGEMGRVTRKLGELRKELKEERRKHGEVTIELEAARKVNDNLTKIVESHQEEAPWKVDRQEISITNQELGRGSWGAVNVAYFRGTPVAAKCLHDLIISDFNISVFIREINLAAKLRHPNLALFVGATLVGSPIILSELMPTSLRKEMEKGRLTQPQIIKISSHICHGLNYLHLFQPSAIVHRDVSDANVLLEPSGGGGQWKAKLSDYGSANLIQNISPNSVAPGCVSYAAPEARFPDDHSPAMDVYSFGVLLMEMILHTPPSPTVAERKAQSQTIQWQSMKVLVQHCLNEDRHKRPSIAHVLSELGELGKQ